MSPIEVGIFRGFKFLKWLGVSLGIFSVGCPDCLGFEAIRLVPLDNALVFFGAILFAVLGMLVLIAGNTKRPIVDICDLLYPFMQRQVTHWQSKTQTHYGNAMNVIVYFSRFGEIVLENRV